MFHIFACLSIRNNYFHGIIIGYLPFLSTGGSSWGRGHKLDTFDAYVEYAGDNAVSNNTGRTKESSSLATDGVRATLAALFSRHGLSGAAGILVNPHSGTVPPPPQSRTPLQHSGYSGDVKSEAKSTDAVPEGLPIATTYNTAEPRVDIEDCSNPSDNVARSPLTPADRGGYPPVVMTGMFPRGHGRGWGPPPSRHPVHSNPPAMHPNLPPPVVENIPPIYTRPPPPIPHRPMNPWGAGRGGGKYKQWNAQGHSTNR